MKKYFNIKFLTTFGVAALVLTLTTAAHNHAWAQAQLTFPKERLYSSLNPTPPLFQMIKAAKKTIDIEIYTMEHPQVRALLRDAMKRGVQVRIIKDPTPFNDDCPVFPAEIIAKTGGDANLKDRKTVSPNNAADCADQRKFVQEVNSKPGSAYVPFNKNELCKDTKYVCFQHGKLAIADSTVALVSTGNFDDSNFCLANPWEKLYRCNRDYTYVTTDADIVRSLKVIFEADLKGKRYDLLELMKNERVSRRVVISPYSSRQLVAFIDSAKQTVHIQNQYLKEKYINEALMRAANRGVKVTVNVSSACSFRKPTDYDIQTTTEVFTAFDNAGIKTQMFTGRQKQSKGQVGYLHAKAIVVDGRAGWVGSINGSITSVANNREYGIFFLDRGSIANLLKQMEADFTHPEAETWQESLQCKNDPLPKSQKVSNE